MQAYLQSLQHCKDCKYLMLLLVVMSIVGTILPSRDYGNHLHIELSSLPERTNEIPGKGRSRAVAEDGDRPPADETAPPPDEIRRVREGHL